MIFKIIFILLGLFSASYGLDYSLVLKNDIVELKILSPSDIIGGDNLTKKEYILLLNANVKIDEELWGYDITKISSFSESKGSKLVFTFDKSAYRPNILKENNFFVIRFVRQNSQAYSSGNSFVRMFMGIVVIIIFILFCYVLFKIMMKKQLNSNIPGSGRLLGKVDIFPGKSLVFYELVESVYILSMTSDSLTVIDKIYDPITCDKIKEGFARKKDFSSYMRFFGKNIDAKDIDITNEILQEKVERLRKK